MTDVIRLNDDPFCVSYVKQTANSYDGFGISRSPWWKTEDECAARSSSREQTRTWQRRGFALLRRSSSHVACLWSNIQRHNLSNYGLILTRTPYWPISVPAEQAVCVSTRLGLAPLPSIGSFTRLGKCGLWTSWVNGLHQLSTSIYVEDKFTCEQLYCDYIQSTPYHNGSKLIM